VPKRDTLVAIARAFSVSESTVTAIAFEAMGYDLEAVRRETDLSTATTEQIVRALADRVGVGRGAGDDDAHGHQPAPIDDDPGGLVAELHHMDADARQRAAVRDAQLPDDLAARRTGRKPRAQEARDKQDDDSER